ncbi:MAG: hypothetical protein K1X82_00920 [Bacteroidia bacterium]|nr:hypothetical protein [Bacteroidia bacterium]
MMTPQRRKEVEKLLQSQHLEIVLDTLDLIKNEGDINLIKPLASLMNETDNEEIIKTVIEIFRGIKDQSAVPFLIEVLENNQSFGNRSSIVAACWEGGLKFDSHLSFFVDLALRENYLVALECVTLIENMGNDIPETELLTNIAKIKQNLEPGEDKKDELLVALIGILDEKRSASLQN